MMFQPMFKKRRNSGSCVFEQHLLHKEKIQWSKSGVKSGKDKRPSQAWQHLTTKGCDKSEWVGLGGRM